MKGGNAASFACGVEGILTYIGACFVLRKEIKIFQKILLGEQKKMDQ